MFYLMMKILMFIRSLSWKMSYKKNKTKTKMNKKAKKKETNKKNGWYQESTSIGSLYFLLFRYHKTTSYIVQVRFLSFLPTFSFLLFFFSFIHPVAFFSFSPFVLFLRSYLPFETDKYIKPNKILKLCGKIEESKK